MNSQNISFSQLIVMLSVVLLLSACGSGVENTHDLDNPGDFEKPAMIAIEPASGSVLHAYEPILIRLDETIDPDSLSVGGDLATFADAPEIIWSVVANDTIRIAPVNAWPERSEASSLTLSVADTTGNRASNMRLAYTVDARMPSVVENFVVPEALRGDDTIRVPFTESISLDSVKLTGSLAAETRVALETTTYPDDTLVLSARNIWSSNSAHTLYLSVEDIAGNQSSPFGMRVAVDGDQPGLTVLVPSQTAIQSDTTLEFIFSKNMVPTSLVVSGDMAAERNLEQWSMITNQYRRLIITPADVWTTGSSRTINIEVEDVSGYRIQQSLVYHVETVHADVNAADGGDGSVVTPFNTLNDAVSFAAANGLDQVVAKKGVYPELVRLQDGVSIVGGFGENWEAFVDTQNALKTRITGGKDEQSGQYVSVSAVDLTAPVQLKWLDIAGPDVATQDSGQSTYALYVRNVSGLTVSESHISGGRAADGAAGESGLMAGQLAPTTAAAGQNGLLHQQCNATDVAAGGTRGGELLAGAAGGAGGAADTQCGGTKDYMPVAGATGGIVEGVAAAAGDVCQSGANGNDGATVNGTGGSGGHLLAGTILGGDIVDGLWQMSQTATAGNTGEHGVPGNGGAGSGACSDPLDLLGGYTGAGGGAGGTAGVASEQAGGPGQSGGSSFALFAVNSSVQVDRSRVVSGVAGNGGQGGVPGLGQPGGEGGAGGIVPAMDIRGGRGGRGGDGGASGGGGGGAGGHSISVFAYGRNVSLNSSLVFNAPAGQGGAGGALETAPAGTGGTAGVNGISQQLVGDYSFN